MVSVILRSKLIDQGLRRSEFADELRAEVGRLGGTPTDSGSMAASLHRGWIALRSAASVGDPKGIIAACETGEHSAYANYEAASNMDFLPRETQQAIESQFRIVRRSCEWLEQIHQQLASGVRTVP